MAKCLIEVSLQFADGSSTGIEVERGTTVEVISRHEILKLPRGFCAKLVTESAEALEPDTQILVPQARCCSKS